MANSKLEDKTFPVPEHVISTVKPGTMRSDFVLRRKDGLSYYNIKRLKHFYDNQSEKDPETHQALGEDLQKWVENTLGTHRDSMYKGKKIKSDVGMLNVFKSAHTKDKGKHSHKTKMIKPQTNARQIFTSKNIYETEEYDIFNLNDSIYEEISEVLDESLITKYKLIIESPLYNNVSDIISDIMYYENKFKKYKK